MSNVQLVEMARESLEYAKEGTIPLAEEVFKVPAENYFAQDRFDQEVDLIFKRMPLMLAASAELKNAGDYKAMDPVGVPIVLVRGKDGEVRAFLNSCTHRGAPLVDSGAGHVSRFSCPYHAWSFSLTGDLVAIASKHEFGDIDQSCYGLTPLPVVERAGLIWGILDPKSPLDIDTFLCGYDELLNEFDFANWHVFQQRVLRGPNWKVAYDGYLDLYHLPVLHRETFGADVSNQAVYRAWGPHQRVTSPTRHMIDRDESDWKTEELLMGVWTIFPHISIASFYGGGRAVMISQLFPGNEPGESFTTQTYLMEKEPEGEQVQEAQDQFNFLETVVAEEDYKTGLRQQQALEAGALSHVLFGRNEGGGQHFHGWVDRLLETETEDLNKAFAELG